MDLNQLEDWHCEDSNYPRCEFLQLDAKSKPFSSCHQLIMTSAVFETVSLARIMTSNDMFAGHQTALWNEGSGEVTWASRWDLQPRLVSWVTETHVQYRRLKDATSTGTNFVNTRTRSNHIQGFISGYLYMRVLNFNCMNTAKTCGLL